MRKGQDMKPHQIFLMVIATSLLAACSQGGSDESTVSAPTHPDAKLIARAGAPLFDGMGSHHHYITRSNPGAQRYFDQGLIIDFAFNHAESGGITARKNMRKIGATARGTCRDEGFQ